MITTIITFLIIYQIIGFFLLLKEELENPMASLFFIGFYPIILLYRFIKNNISK
jgi:hypothetical protein